MGGGGVFLWWLHDKIIEMRNKVNLADPKNLAAVAVVNAARFRNIKIYLEEP